MNMPFDFARPQHEREAHIRELLQQGQRTSTAHLLGQSPGMTAEKHELAARILRDDPDDPALLPLVRHLKTAAARELAAASLDRSELLLELARHHPAQVRPHADDIQDPRVLSAMRAEAPEDWLARLDAEFTAKPDVSLIRAVGELRSERALSWLFRTSKIVPADDFLGSIAVALENCGCFYRSRFPSIYDDAFRGYVVARSESPHHMGAGFPHSVPFCLFCQTPGERLLTLDADALGEDYELDISPSFFWYRCTCDNADHMFVRHTADGVEGVATIMMPAPTESSLPATSLLLEPFPRTSVVGGPARPGAGEHQVGGYPVWIDYQPFASVPVADRGAMFLASIDLACTPHGQKSGQRGIVYCFFDHETRISISYRQLPAVC